MAELRQSGLDGHQSIRHVAAGIGSEGYVAVQNERRFIGVELKRSYWQQAVLNIKAAESASQEALSLFSSSD